MRLCSACPKWLPPIRPSGPAPCRVLFMGEAPAKSENRKGIPFAGASGQELDDFYLPRAGLSRSQVGVTNAMKCSLRGYRNPDREQARACASCHLPRELELFDPEVIVPLGAVACSLFEPELSLELHHGMAVVRTLFGWTGPVLPNYHPAAGMRDSKLLYHLHRDFPLLGKYLRGEVGTWEPEERPGDYALCKTVGDVSRELDQCSPYELAVDTETDSQGPEPDPRSDPPYMLSFSGRENAGRVVMAEDQELIEELRLWIKAKDPVVVLHNALFDMPVTRRMGLPLPWPRVHDTMLDAYHTGWMDQGLKTLAYRHLDAVMGDFEDMVKPHALQPQLDWLGKVALAEDIEQPWLGKRQWSIMRKAGSAWRGVLDKGADPHDRVKNWIKDEERDFLAAEEAAGKFPWRSIRFVPLPRAVYYAGMDAARTWELRGITRREMIKVRRMSHA